MTRRVGSIKKTRAMWMTQSTFLPTGESVLAVQSLWVRNFRFTANSSCVVKVKVFWRTSLATAVNWFQHFAHLVLPNCPQPRSVLSRTDLSHLAFPPVSD